MSDIIFWTVLSMVIVPGLIVLAYGIGRAFGLGHSRSRMEHWRRLRHELENGDEQ